MAEDRLIFLINASNLKAGGGLQVADSICGQLNRFKKYHFIVVLSSYLDKTEERIKSYENVDVFRYDIPNSFKTILLGKDEFLDTIVRENGVGACITVFGPSRWKPKVPHLSGFALPQMVIPESPYFKRMSKIELVKWWVWRKIRQFSLKRSADCYWTENPYITQRLKVLLKKKPVYTVSNYYNQIFDQPENWKRSKTLPNFNGVTCLSISANYPHKNFLIIPDVVRVLKKVYPDLKVRFVLTIDECEMPVGDDVKDSFLFIGKVDVSECPYLYKQADIMFMPSLLECFSATYPEAMCMGVPIVTTDLDFAHGLCGDSACYYSSVNASSAAEAIYQVATNESYRLSLISKGKEQLKKFDNYSQRAEKLIGLLGKMLGN